MKKLAERVSFASSNQKSFGKGRSSRIIKETIHEGLSNQWKFYPGTYPEQSE